MKTKLVYVLTCAPDGYYIEQALMSIYSAKYWNPDAYIALITDNQTNELLEGKRAELLNYISKKIVIQFNKEKSMMYRSRFLKTMVRELIDGDFLFIDCDTIVCKSLADIYNWNIEVGAVYESHLKVNEFCDALYQSVLEPNLRIGVDLSKEEEYFSSGVLFVKDTPSTHRLYDLWHKNWLESQSIGVPIDQPSLCKANIQCNYIIKKIPDTYNTILFTQCSFTRDAHILHIAAYRNPSFLFKNKTLDFIKRNGLHNDWLVDSIINPCNTFLPFDYDILHSSLRKRIDWIKDISKVLRLYGETINNSFIDIFSSSRIQPLIISLCKNGHTRESMIIWMLWKRWQVKYKKTVVSNNICKKEK